MELTLLLSLLMVMFAAGIHFDPPNRPTLQDNAYVRTLFRTADSIDGAPDGHLTLKEMDDILEFFDTDNNGVVSETEFTATWLKYHLGHKEGSLRFFHNADTDKDGSLSKDPDMTRMFQAFDMDGNGSVNEAEFMIIWISLSS